MTFDAATIDDLFFVVLAVLAGISAIGALAYNMGVRHERERAELADRHARLIDRLRQRIEPATETPVMPRRPLTKEQLQECLDKNCSECPRCGNDGITPGELEDTSEDDQESAQKGYTCDDCGEKWIVTFTPTSIESDND